MAPDTFLIAASTDDQHVFMSATTWDAIASGTPTRATSNLTVAIFRDWNGSTFRVHNGLLRFDTSTITEAATGATLSVYGAGHSDTDSRNFTGEWYVWDETNADYIRDGSATAFSVPMSSLTTSAWNNIPLTAPENVNTSGYTYLRLHIDGGEPTGLNRFAFRSWDHDSGGEFTPQLIVESGTPQETTTSILEPDGFAAPLEGVSGTLTDEWLVS